MNKRIYVTLIILAAVAAIGAACTPGPGAGTSVDEGEPEAVSHGGEVVDYVSLVDALRAEGAEVEPAGEVEQPFFDVTGQVITVNGEDVQVFEYESTEAAAEQASLIGPSGSEVGTSMVTWIDTPHFYQQGRLIVLYVGGNGDVLSLLKGVVGSQIAGG